MAFLPTTTTVTAAGRNSHGTQSTSMPQHDQTTRWCVLVACLGVLLASFGSACLTHASMCPATDKTSIGILLVMIGGTTLVPVTACLAAYFLDRKHQLDDHAKIPLLASPRIVMGRATRYRTWVYLYTSHFLTSWIDRMWQYAVPLLLTELFPATLLQNVVFQLVVYVFLVLTMPFLGQFVDRVNRWRVLRVAVVSTNAMVLASTAAFGMVVFLHETTPDHWLLYPAMAVVLACSAVGQMFNDLQTLSLEKDWIVELSNWTDTPLAPWNTSFLRMDLTARILAPTAFTFLVDAFQGTSPLFLLVGIAAWAILLAPLEYATLADVYAFCPPLADKKRPKVAPSYGAMWTTYFANPTFLVSFSFCALYMTVLKENALSSAYLIWHGAAPSAVGWTMGLGAYCGFLSTLAFPHLLRAFQYAESVALSSVWAYFVFLLPALYVVLWPLGPAADIVLMTVLAASQFWLWCTSLAETQIMQEWVQPDRRGVVNAMQHTTNKGFYILLLAVGAVFADPTDFPILIAVSLVATLAAAIGVTLWYHRHRDT
ncbi:Aste57867_16 [Aphanomyces stellatus]|uniref:Solute carrier family 40 member n=1 Tax=Aphanomyces stellatus TaxID=120398 RepID=A0A485K6G5_9STRA|nr:hypothetical protein As57867_000016 [Aphanomyces stellatus]VFT77242.1 Aste57867_16 [Aphanomyces stellatus]